MKTDDFLGARLRLIRQFHGLTLAELGNSVSNSRQYVNQLESGQKYPTEGLLDVLCDELGVRHEFFLHAPKKIDPDECNFRKLKSTAVRASEQVIAHAALFGEFVNYLENHIDLIPLNIPQISVTDTKSVEDIAEECRQYWHLTTDQPIRNMTRVLESAGAIVTTFRSVSEKIDALSVNNSRPIIVRSVAKKSPTRLRFDLAHECGHIVMHTSDCRIGHDMKELEANQFAAAFLLPAKAFIEEFPSRPRLDWRGMFAMKKDWNVSVQAILRRAFDLKLITSTQYRSGNIYISKQGYKRNEPLEPKNSEEAELIKNSVSLLQGHYKRSLENAAEDLHLTQNCLAKLLGIPLTGPSNKDANVVDISGELTWASDSWAK